MRPDRHVNWPDEDQFGVGGGDGEAPPTPIERVVVAVRLVVILSVGALLVLGPDSVRAHLALAISVLGVAAVYAVAVALNPGWEVRRTGSAWLTTGMDSMLALLAIATTGAASSPAVSVLVLAVVAAAIRLPLSSTIGLVCAVSAVYTVIVLYIGPHVAPLSERVLDSVWWSVYLLLTAILGGSLSVLAEREHEARAAARIAASAEHKAAEEERDLRARLLESYQAQRDGLHVILHEFRTPMASLGALTKDLADAGSGLADRDREKSTRLVAEHVQHLSEMLEALGDVAASREPSFGAGSVRNVDLYEFLAAAGDAAGLRAPRLQISLRDNDTSVRVDQQQLRRVMTNLLENAARHGNGDPVEVHAWLGGEFLNIHVLDRGPGVAPERLRELTNKYTALSERSGNAGLGLWIVDQILQAMGGRLELGGRSGGGMAARVEVPVA